ncbi:protocadherin gamma-A2-like isoform X2 [Argopecten irradians]|uniref:protocadherin gamma-A2-like isoform X2 n=1 Tax=Argopecten irradians TaxID=31199 RepID=UPI00372426BE
MNAVCRINKGHPTSMLFNKEITLTCRYSQTYNNMAWILIIFSLFLGVDSTHFNFSVLENMPPGTYLGTVEGVGAGPNDTLPMIHLSPPPIPFTVELRTGGLYSFFGLDREAKSIYKFDVLETIDGVDTLLANVTVHILDVNDNAPVFSRQMYNVSIKEETPVSTDILTLQSTDADEGNKLVYRIVTQPSPFAINSTTGVLSVQQTLKELGYAVQAQVSDGKFQTSAMVYITVIFPDSVVG